MGGSAEKVLDDVLAAGGHADAALATAGLAAIGIERGALEVAAAGDGDDDVLHLDEVFDIDLALIVDDLRTARVAEVFLHFLELGDDDGAELHVAREDFEIAGDEALDFGEFV